MVERRIINTEYGEISGPLALFEDMKTSYDRIFDNFKSERPKDFRQRKETWLNAGLSIEDIELTRRLPLMLDTSDFEFTNEFKGILKPSILDFCTGGSCFAMNMGGSSSAHTPLGGRLIAPIGLPPFWVDRQLFPDLNPTTLEYTRHKGVNAGMLLAAMQGAIEVEYIEDGDYDSLLELFTGVTDCY